MPEIQTHAYPQFHIPPGPQLQHVTEKQLFSTGPTGWLSARLLMTSIWGSHRFPVALIKSRLIKTFAIHPVLTLQVVFSLSLSAHSTLMVVCLFSCWGERSYVYGETEKNRGATILHPLPSPRNSQTAAQIHILCFYHWQSVLTFALRLSRFIKFGKVLVNRANFVCFTSNIHAPEGRHSAKGLIWGRLRPKTLDSDSN